MEIPPVGYSSPRDILAVTTPKVIEDLDRASTTNIAEVYLLSQTRWIDSDGQVNEVNPQIKEIVENFIDDNPKSQFFVGVDLATKVADGVTTWGNFKPEISPELNTKIIDWISEGILTDDEEMTVMDVAIVAEMISGRIAVGDSFLTLKDLERLKEKIEEKVTPFLDKNDKLKQHWEKIINDIKVTEMMGL